MDRPEDIARRYLADFLEREEIDQAQASAITGHDHAYINQYLRQGKPKWLGEAERLALARAYPTLDGEKLRPPLPPNPPNPSGKRAIRQRENQPKIHPEGYGKFVDDPSTLDMLEVWERITDPRDRVVAMNVLRTLADRAAPAPPIVA